MERQLQIIQIVEKNPGIRFRELLRVLNVESGTLSYHLHKLERTPRIRVERTTRVCRLYPIHFTDSEIAIAKRLRQETPRRILRLLLDTEETNFSEMFLRIQKSPATTSFYATQLVQDGVIKDKFERGKRFFSIVDKEIVGNLISKYHPDLMERATDNFSDMVSSL